MSAFSSGARLRQTDILQSLPGHNISVERNNSPCIILIYFHFLFFLFCPNLIGLIYLSFSFMTNLMPADHLHNYTAYARFNFLTPSSYLCKIKTTTLRENGRHAVCMDNQQNGRDVNNEQSIRKWPLKHFRFQYIKTMLVRPIRFPR